MALKNVEDIYPLSPMQGLMLMNAIVGHDATLLANQVRYEIRGQLRTAAFHGAWEDLVARHAALRSAILWEGLERPLQVVREQVDLPWEEVDLSGLTEADASARLTELVQEDARRPFNLASAPLMRCMLVRMRDDHHVLVWTIHHLVVDRWSHGTLFAELAVLYEARVRDKHSTLPAAPGFGRYIAWLAERDEQEAERFWREELSGFRNPTRLGAASARDDDERRTTRRILSADVTAALLERASSWRLTPASLVLAGVGLYLALSNRSSDVVFGVTVSGRPADLDGVEATVGSFVNNVPVRLRLDPAQALPEWVRDVHLRQLKRQPFEHVSPAAIRDASDVPSQEALFDVLVVPNLTASGEPDWLELDARVLGASFDAAYPFVLGVGMQDPGLELALVHGADFPDGEDVLAGIGSVLEKLSKASNDTRVGTFLPDDFADATTAESAASERREGEGAEELAAPREVRAAGQPSSLQEALLDIWGEVFGSTHEDLDSDFFDLGGTSLQAVQVLRRVERYTGRVVPLSALFDGRTVRGLLTHLGGDPGVAPDPGIPRVSGADSLPLSFAQERLWVLSRLEEDSSQYNLPIAYRIDGPLEPDLIRRSLTLLAERHEVLRTHYAVEDGQPRQVIDDPSSSALAWEVEDLSDFEDEAHKRSHIEAASAIAMPLGTGPLFRGTLFRLDAERHALLFVLHHSIADAWSIGVLERDLSGIYRALAAGDSPALPALPVQYADFAVWQREHMQGDVLGQQLGYWRDQLAGAGPLDLPADRARPSAQSFRGAVHRVSLAPDLVDELKRLAAAESVTLYMVLMAAFHALLFRYTGQSDVTVGTPYSGRTRAEVEGLIGMFVNTIVIRTRPAAETTFRELLAEVRDASAEAHSFQDVPFEKLVESLNPERDLSRNPLFQVMFGVQDSRVQELGLTGLDVSPYEVTHDTSKFDLTLFLQSQSDTPGTAPMEGIWEYATDLFDEATVERMHGHFDQLLRAIVAGPEAPISDLRMIGEEEREALLGEAVPRSAEVEPEPLMLARFSDQCARHGDRVAVTDEVDSVTYRELDVQSNRLAHHLVDLGVRSGVIVGIFLPRSAELVVAMLSVLKTGAAYVPLDPDHPKDRLAYMLADSQAAIVVTTSELLEDLPSVEAGTVRLDHSRSELDACDDAPIDTVLARDQLAYTIYTSGSTGRPKGVEVEHANLSNFLASMAEEPGLSADDVLLAVTTLSFDIAGLELWLPLWVGARVEIAKVAETRDGRRLKERLSASGATVMQATPSTWRMLLEAGWTGRLSKVLCGGEAFPRDLVEPLMARADEVWNLYGPTETTIWSTVHRVEAGDSEGGSVPIGRPIANTRVYVRDPQGALSPQGVPGELWIGGRGVARGYHALPERTADRFEVSPFAAGERLYGTGDLVRWRNDGRLEHLGRLDDQVKVHGHRIELGEIEAVLVGHEAVRQAVAAVKGGAEDARLVAFVVHEPGRSATGSEMRRFLRQRLPDYMVPGVIGALEALPLTPNGKVDRSQLPDPTAGAVSRAFVAPRTETEQLVADIWQELLGTERISRHDNFFELGGHSLLAIRMVARVLDELGAEVRVAVLFEDPVLSSFCEAIDAGTAGNAEGAAWDRVALLDPGMLPDVMEPGFGQEAIWFIEQTGMASTAYHLFSTLRFEGDVDEGAVSSAISLLVERHESLRYCFPDESGVPALAVREAAGPWLEAVDLEGSSGSEAEPGELLRSHADAPFSLSEGPLFRALWVRLGPDEHVLQLCVHHLVADGESLSVLWADFVEAFAAYSMGEDPDLGPVPPSYRAWVYRARAEIESPRLEDQFTYWAGQLERPVAPLEIASDASHGTVDTLAGRSYGKSLSAQAVEAVRGQSGAGLTPFVCLLSALEVVLHRFGGSDEIAVGVPTRVASDDAEWDRAVGMYINTIVLRARLDPDLTFRELLERNRARAAEAWEHRDYPFSKLVERLKPRRSRTGTPFFDVLLSLRHDAGSEVQCVGDVEVTSIPIERTGAQAELVFYLDWRGDEARLHVDYSTALFDEPTVARIVGCLDRVLVAGLGESTGTLSALDIVDPSERERLLESWSGPDTGGTSSADVVSSSVVDRLALMVESCSSSIAVGGGGGSLTYEALWRRSGAVARSLRVRGVGRGTRVGVSMDRGSEMVVTLLGIWRSGSAYVPLDPTFPVDRQAYMVADSGARLVVTDAAGSDRAWDVETVLLADAEREGSESDTESGVEDELPEVGSDDLAYVLYTSGSTGRPKGVEVEHGNLSNFMASMAEEPGLRADDVLLAVTTLSFDIAGLELWLPLWVGARVEIADVADAHDGRRLQQRLTASGATVMQATPSTWRMLLEAGWTGRLSKVLCGGEAFPQDLVEPLLARADEVWNLYGPTETTIWSTVHRVEAGDVGAVPIGRPIANTRVYVRDAQGALSPQGVPGELWIGGRGVARGYHALPERTADRFEVSPFEPDERLYRTGDLVRWRNDGRLEHLGRLDDQVKVHGHRIELGEIEAILVGHEAVRQAVAVVKGGAEDARLVAFVVHEPGRSATGSEMRRFLRKRLPDYMVPGVIGELEALPLTPNEKVDRSQLPDPTAGAVSRAFVAPRTETEQLIADIWQELLDVERISTHDNFFELGGHSLLAIRATALVGERHAGELEARAMFFLTLEQIAAQLANTGK